MTKCEYNINTELIINRLKDAKKLTSDAQVANFLGIKPNTLSSWKSRNSLDFALLFAKCEDISIDYIVYGRGSMLYTEKTPTLPAPIADNPPSDQSLAAIAEERERTIQVLQDTNRNLLDEIKQLRAYVGVTSAKYIQIVDQTLAEAKLTNTLVLQLQAQVALCAGAHAAPAAPSAPSEPSEP